MFQFQGSLSSSKSLLNRALIIQSYFPDLVVNGSSQARDVQALRKALKDLQKSEFHAEEGGTTFRFLVLRLSRLPGERIIWASPQLLKRPQESLVEVLNQLGVQCEIFADHWVIHSNGWVQPKNPLKVLSSESSQFLSSVLLNAWDLSFDLQIQVEGELQSEPYFQMTHQMVAAVGMQVQKQKDGYFISRGQKAHAKEIYCEPDMSSAFSLAACGIVNGNVVIEAFPEKSLQADFCFLRIFEEMKIHFHHDKNQFKIRKQNLQTGIHIDLGDSPDLFPVLAALCALAPGRSVLSGAPHLKFKESDRIAGIEDLLTQIRCPFQSRSDGIEIEGPAQVSLEHIQYDPRNDHRLAMAAGVLKLAGFQIQILNKDCVQKSFPEFWQMIGVE